MPTVGDFGARGTRIRRPPPEELTLDSLARRVGILEHDMEQLDQHELELVRLHNRRRRLFRLALRVLFYFAAACLALLIVGTVWRAFSLLGELSASPALHSVAVDEGST